MLLLTALWSPSFLFIKLALTEFHPIAIATLRVSIGAILLSAILCFCRRPLPKNSKFWLHTAILALFSSVLPFYLFSYAEMSIESAMAAILNGTTPMFTALLAHVFIPTDRLHLQKIVGISLSVLGLVCLFAPQLQEGLSADLVGMSAGLAASFSYAVSHIYAKRNLTGQPPFVAPAAQLIASSLILAPVFFCTSASSIEAFPSLTALCGIGGLALFGTTLAFIFYFKLLEVSGPTAISMVACFFPVGGMLLGFIFLGETFTLGALASSFLIVLGVMLVNGVIPLRKQASSVLSKHGNF